MAEMTAFGGTLIRWAKNTWAWSDNSPAPNVRDMTASQYFNFRIRGGQWLEVPVLTVRENDYLHWVERGDYEISLSDDHYECVGAQWPDADRDAIFSKARSLGFAV